jgi:hypothetical protein
MYYRYVKDLEMHNIRFNKLEKDERPALICEKIDRLQMDSVRSMNESDQQAVLLRDVKILKTYEIIDFFAILTININ